jgi:hypothetical protein
MATYNGSGARRFLQSDSPVAASSPQLADVRGGTCRLSAPIAMADQYALCSAGVQLLPCSLGSIHFEPRLRCRQPLCASKL